MAGFRLAPRAAQARRRPWQRRRLVALYAPPSAVLSLDPSTATATGSLTLTAPPFISGTSTATAEGSLSLTTGSVGGERAGPGIIGWYVLESATASTPVISGGSNATATGSLSLLTPTAAIISGTSRGVAFGTMALTIGGTGVAYIIRPTSLLSPQFGSTSLNSPQFGEKTLVVSPASSIVGDGP